MHMSTFNSLAGWLIWQEALDTANSSVSYTSVCFMPCAPPCLQVSNPTLEEAIRGFRVIKNDTTELVFDKPGEYRVPERSAFAAVQQAVADEAAKPSSNGASRQQDEVVTAAADVTAKAFKAVLQQAGAQ